MYTFIGMSFMGFVTVLIAAIIAALVLHYAARYRFRPGFSGFMSKWVIAWFGAWLGSPVIGHWWFQIGGVWAIPALIGAFMGAFLVTAVWKNLAYANSSAAQAQSMAAGAGH